MELGGFPGRGPGAAGHAGADKNTDRLSSGTEASDNGFESIGLPAEAGWYVSAALYWIGGLTIVLVDQFSSNTEINPVIGLLGTITLASSPLLLLGARFAPDATWGAFARILMPSLILVVGGFVIGDAIGAIVMIFLFPVLAIAYMHRPKVSIPYCFGALVMMDAMLLAHESSNENIARVIVLTGVSAALIVGLIVAQNRVRTAAAKNHSHSVTDPLTGLSNLRGLRARLRQELHRSARDESEIVMFAIDLDDFKEVNDRFSYALGDAVLQAVAHALENEIEPGDLLARRGGDEFAILTVATPGRHMARFGDRIAASIERTRRAICPGVNPRASVTRVNHRHGESAEHFLRRVDDGLHDAKLDAHPERIGHEPGGTGDHPEVGADEQRSPLLEGARRVQLGLRHPARPERARSATTLEWRMTAATAFVPAALIAIIVGFGLVPDAERPSTLFCVLGLLVCAGLSFAAAGSTVDRRWLHVSVAVTTTLTIACVALSGDASYPMAELCILPAPLAVMLFGWKRAMPYAIVSAGAFAYIVIDAGGQFAILQSALTIGVIAVLVVLLQRGERLTTQFTAAAEAISIVDPLTGAANLRGFVSRVEQEIARCDALGEELSLVMIDLDRFKAVNDRYSHSMGDALLIETTRAIESVVREDEMVVRRGGDEFVVICAAGVPRELDALTGRLADAIFTARIRLTPDIAAGATVINVYRRHAEDAESFMRRADEELRLAKARERAGSPRS